MTILFWNNTSFLEYEAGYLERYEVHALAEYFIPEFSAFFVAAESLVAR